MSEEKDLQDIELRTEEVNEILTSPPRWLYRWGISLIFLFIFLGLLLSYFIQYPDTLSGKATLTNLNPPVKLVAKTNGKIKQLFVKNNEPVKKDQVLAVVENTANFKHILEVDSCINLLEEQHQVTESPSLFNTRTPYLLGDLTGSYLQFLKAYKSFQLYTEINSKQKEISILERELIEYQSLLSKYKRQEVLGKEEFELTQKDYERQNDLFAKGVIAAQEFDTKKKEYINAQKNLENYTITLSNTKITINNLEKSKLELEIQHIEQLNQLKAELQSSVKTLKAAIAQWKQNFLFVSPVDGQVSFFNFWAENQNVKSGDDIFNVVPSEKQDILVKLQIPIQNSGKIKSGQKVNVKLDDYPSQEHGMLIGYVKSISLVPNNNNYSVDVILPDGLVTSYQKTLSYKEEMSGSAEIILERLSLLQRLFNRFRQLAEKK